MFLVWLRRERAAVAAGFRYLLVHVFGGLCLLGGIVLYWSQSGSLAFGDMSAHAGTAAFALILVAFLLNAAVPPLGAWLPDAYPEATVTGAVFLTAFTTKSAVYALIRGFAGTELLVWWGAAMAVYGVVYAVLENDARRLLAYHIISQVGYMVCGVGLGTELALNGTTAHAFSHILYKALLFMGAGAVLEVTGRRNLSEMGGLLQDHARDAEPLHDWRVRHLSRAAVQRLRQQIDGRVCGRRIAPGGDLPDADAGVGRDVPAHGAQASVLHVLRPRPRSRRS